MRRHLRFVRDESGQALIEFALVLPILITILFGIISFGIAYNHYLELTDATRVGARAAATQADQASACTTANAVVPATLSGAGVACTSTTVNGDPAVKVTGTFPFTISVYGLTLRSGNLTSIAVERVG